MMHRLLLAWCILLGSKLFCGNVIARPEQIEVLRIMSMIEIYPYLKLHQISKASLPSVNLFQIAESNYASIPLDKTIEVIESLPQAYVIECLLNHKKFLQPNRTLLKKYQILRSYKTNKR